MAESRAEAQATYESTLQHHSQMVYEGRVVSLRVDTITKPDGHSYKREVIVHSGAVVVVPIDSEGKIILVRQWRRAAARILTELPAGTLEPPEEPIACADRELQEEIGYKANKITPLGGFFSAPGFCTEYLYLFLAEDLSESQLEPDDNEAIDVLRVTLDEALEMIGSGEICDAKSVAGILRYRFLK